ncbi:hypothetical protein M9H77_34580 [Catharanthus roseus]|uniref:Uncharacterized protein n=1 Tax=Catharanthus roseus TaxID=4058 RepID=A0ACB9ZLU6_CATRO|nr:hypothetical protein M9H77_34580 [Catharanthus roseus]
MVHGSKKKKAHPETSTPTSAFIFLRMSASPATTSIFLAILALFPQLSYSSPATISTPSSLSYAERTSMRPAPLSLAHPPVPPVKGIWLIKCHFFWNICIAPTSNRLVQSRLLKSSRNTLLKLMQGTFKYISLYSLTKYVLLQKRYRWDPLHERVIWDIWEKRTSLRYKDLMYEVRTDDSDAFKKKREATQRNCLQGHSGKGPTSIPTGLVGENGRDIYTIRVVCSTALAKGTMAKYQELKANATRLHIETGSPMPTYKQLMFKDTSGSNKGHVYNFGSQSSAITIE